MAVIGLRSMWSKESGLTYCAPGIDPVAEEKSFKDACAERETVEPCQNQGAISSPPNFPGYTYRKDLGAYVKEKHYLFSLEWYDKEIAHCRSMQQICRWGIVIFILGFLVAIFSL